MKINVDNWKLTCPRWPTQLDIFDTDGNYYYVRYRNDCGRIVKSTKEEKERLGDFCIEFGSVIYEWESPHAYPYYEKEEIILLLSELFDFSHAKEMN